MRSFLPFCLEDWGGRTSSIGTNDRHTSLDGPNTPRAAPHGLRHTALQLFVGILGVVFITVAAVQLHFQKLPPPSSVGPGTISLLYLIVIVYVSMRAGLVASVAVSLVAVFCMDYFFLPLFSSLEAKNPLDIVATLTFFMTACVITGMTARVRHLTNAQLTLQFQASKRLLEVQETERQHLARELHDEIGQLLTGLRLLLRLNGDSPADALKTRFEQARTIVDDLLGQGTEALV